VSWCDQGEVRVGAAEAERIGFVTRVGPVDDLDGAVDELAATLAAKSPLIMRWGHESVFRVVDMNPEDALAYLQAMLTITSASEDTAEGVAAFADKREPKWKGR